MWRNVRAWDMAASATTRSDSTVGALMARGLGEEVTVLDIVRGRCEPEEVLNQIVRTTTADGPTIDVVLEFRAISRCKLFRPPKREKPP